MLIADRMAAGTFDLNAENPEHVQESIRTMVIIDLEPQGLISRVRALPGGAVELVQAVDRGFEPIDDHGTIEKFHGKPVRLELVKADKPEDCWHLAGLASVERREPPAGEFWRELVMTVHPEGSR